jgi:cell division protein FtsA
MPAREFIVAIELGSSKMTGIAGKKNLDGSITVLALVKEDSSSFIHKGVVYNIDKTAQCIANIVKKLTTTLKQEISHVYVGVGGQSIRSVKNNIIKTLPAESIVTQMMVNELMDANRNMSYQDQEILDAATQEYKVDNQLQLDPVGIQCSRLEGNFLNILWRYEFYRRLNKCFDMAGVAIAEMYLAPLALADAVLTDAEKRSGCALVDLGADTTTVSVYYKNILRHLAVIPLGSNNITKDIASLQVEESVAEKLKLQHAVAYTENGDIDSQKTFSLDADRKVDQRKFVEIVEGRLEEIIENVWYQVPSDYAERLLGGIILTGGGSNMPGIETAFANHTHIEKIRVAKFVNQTINAKDPLITAHNGMMNTVLGILAKGNMNCAGNEVDPTKDLFTAPKAATVNTTDELHKTPRQPNELEDGVVQTEAEKRKAEELRRQQEEEERLRLEEEERKREEEERKKEDNGIKNFGSRIKTFVKKLISEPDEDEQ